VKDVDEADFEQEVIFASDVRPVVIDFWAEWCGPCKRLGPMLERLVHEREGRCLLAKVNTDENQNLARYFGISGIPAIKVIHQRKLVTEFEGLLPEPALRQFLDEIAPMDVPPPSETKTVEAPPADPAEMEKRLRSRIEQEGDQSQARIALAQLLFDQNRLDEIATILEPVGSQGEPGEESDRLLAKVWLRQAAAALPPTEQLRAKVAAEPKNAQARLDLGIRLADEGNYEEALEAIFSAAELDFKLASGKAREAMVKVFYCLGTNHALANSYRGKLAGLLY
jgi:putative thioredoxin